MSAKWWLSWIGVLGAIAGCQDADVATQGDSEETGEDSAGTATDVPDDVVPGDRASLVTLEAWARADTNGDPFAPAPAGATCDVGFGEEGGLFEVDTELCTWGTFEQPSLASVRAGDELELVLVHDQLYSEDTGATAVLGLALGDDVVWSQEIPIPSDAAYLRPAFVASEDYPRGTPVRFHVHNHGVNNYRFVDFTVRWVP